MAITSAIIIKLEGNIILDTHFPTQSIKLESKIFSHTLEKDMLGWLAKACAKREIRFCFWDFLNIVQLYNYHQTEWEACIHIQNSFCADFCMQSFCISY